MSNITTHLLKNTLRAKIHSMSTMKTLSYVGVGAFASLGFYRGFSETYAKEHKTENMKFTDYTYCFIFGLMGMSLYINPTLACCAVYHEYFRAKRMITGIDDENVNASCFFYNIR